MKGIVMQYLPIPRRTLLFVSILALKLFSNPALSAASEGPAWVYLLVAPLTLLSTPFFLTTVFVAIAVYCYWQYRMAGNKTLGVVAVLILLVAIPTAFRDKAAFVAERESRQRVERMAKERREARRAGRHVSPDFKAMSTANAQKYRKSGKTEADRLNFQASQDLLRMTRTIDAMQLKEPRSPELKVEKEEAPPARSGTTFLFELYSLIILMAAGWAGALVARWRIRRRLTALVHLAPLCVCLIMPVIAQLPFTGMFAGGTGGRIYFSWLSRIGFIPMPFIVAYLLGILFYHWRTRHDEESPECHTSAQAEEQEEFGQPEPVEQAPPDELVHFICPGCKQAGRIAVTRLPERGLIATCPNCKTRFPVRRDTDISSSRSLNMPVDDGTSMPQEAVLTEADASYSAQQNGFNPLPEGKQYLRPLIACSSYFLLQILAIILSWQLGQRGDSVPLIMTQLLAFALIAPFAFFSVLATRKFRGITAQITGMLFALTTALVTFSVQVAANGSFPLKNLVFDSALRQALLAFGLALTGAGAGWLFVTSERRYGITPHALCIATFRRLRENSFLIACWCLFVLIEGLMSPHFHGDAGLIVIPIIIVVDNFPFLIVWLLAGTVTADDAPSARLAVVLFAGLYALLTAPLHSAEIVFSPVGFFFQFIPFLGVSVMVCALILLAVVRTSTTLNKSDLVNISSLFPDGRDIYPVRNATLAVAVLAACYGAYNGSKERFDPEHLFASQAYPDIVFTDAGGKPLARLPVGVQTIPSYPISFLNIRANREKRFTLHTDANGILHLPTRKPRLATLGIAGLFAGGQHTYLTVLDPRWRVPGSGYSPAYEVQTETTRRTIACNPADIEESLKHGSQLLDTMPLKNWEETIATFENRHGSLNNLSPAQLLDLAGPCDRLVTTTCDRIDNVLLNHPETPELIRKRTFNNFKLFAAVRRSGNYAEPILLALEQDAGMSEWMAILRKEIKLEQEARRNAARPDGRLAAVIHEEALKLHKQKKHAEAFVLYQAVFAAPGPMLSRYFANASYACSFLGMRSWAMRLARQGVLLNSRHDRSTHSYAQEAFYFASYDAAKFWANVSFKTGFRDNDVQSLLGAACVETGDMAGAASCFWRAAGKGRDPEWELPSIRKIGPRPFWQPVQEL
jgi:hypothetical protein